MMTLPVKKYYNTISQKKTQIESFLYSLPSQHPPLTLCDFYLHEVSDFDFFHCVCVCVGVFFDYEYFLPVAGTSCPGIVLPFS